MLYCLIGLAVSIILLIFLNSVKICNGGSLFEGCGKLLFPWTKKYRISSNKYCCEECLKRDFTIMYSESGESKIIFSEKEEYDGIDTDNSKI